MFSERRKKQLEKDGVRTLKVKSTAKIYIKSMKSKGLSIQEGALVVKEMDCILAEMSKCNPNSKIV